MATPLGHAIVGVLVARRLGVTSSSRLASAAVAACVPDADLLAGKLLHGDYWSLHRTGTHSVGFAFVVGMFAGFAGVLGPGTARGDRDVVADALAGAAILVSHTLVDHVWLPYLATGRRSMPFLCRARRESFNVALDATVYGLLAWRLWPRRAVPSS